jgi:uncharacterized protein YbjT (DUF2867 family)
MDARPILLTGATGYVGGRLLTLLEGAGKPVRCLARRPRWLAGRAGPMTEVVEGDVLDPASLDRALAGCRAALYLVHAMGAGAAFAAQERAGAEAFAAAAGRAGLERVVYLGGLGDPDEALSAHLASRQEVGRLLRAGPVPTLELRASIVIGSGSLSFEMIRALTEKLPLMLLPRWVAVEAQPIGIEDLLSILLEALEIPLPASRIIEIGGPERLSYGGLMAEYARQRGLRRWMLRVPALTPRLSSLWLGLVTPLYARVGRKLIDSIRHPTVVRDPTGMAAFRTRPRGASEAIAAALSNEEQLCAATRWSDALSAAGRTPGGWGGVRLGNRLLDTRTALVSAPPPEAFAPVAAIGGREGWYACNGLWRLRGWIDLLAGGVGLRRGRPEGRPLRPGDALDFWRVEVCEPPRRLRLLAEMRLPGRAWLEFEIEGLEDGGSRIRQTAVFDPSGLAGLLYWYGIWPLHALVFRGLLKQLVRRGGSGRSG